MLCLPSTDFRRRALPWRAAAWRRRTRLPILAFLAVQAIATAAPAQTPRPQLPGALIDPERRLEELPQPAPVPPGPSGIGVPGTSPEAPPEGSERVSFRLNGIAIEGAAAYREAELRPLYADLLGTDVTLATLYDIAARIEARYRADGYILSRAVVPAQSVENGVFQIRVIEGYVSDVVVEGDPGRAAGLIRSYLRHITESRPVNLADLERYLLLVNDIPGIAGTGLLQPSGSELGASQLVVTVERDPYGGFALVDNSGSRSTGPWGAAIAGFANGLTRHGDRTDAILFAALDDDEERVAQLGYERRLGSEGLTVRGEVTAGRTRPGHHLEPLEVESESLSALIRLDYPLVRSRAFSLDLIGGFEAADTTTELLGREFNRDRLRVAFGGVEIVATDGWRGSSHLKLGIRQGLGVFGASEAGDDNLSRIEGEPEFTSFGVEATRLQSLVPNVSLYAAIAGQYSLDPLLSREEFAVGGTAFGRGYNSAELTGDHGVGATLELQYNGRTDWAFFGGYQLYAFYDIGAVWNEDGFRDGRQSLASAGIGLRVTLTDYLTADFELAQPLTKNVNEHIDDEKPLRGYARITGRF